MLAEPHRLQRTEGGFRYTDLLNVYGSVNSAQLFFKTFKDSKFYWYEKGYYSTRAFSLAFATYLNIAQPDFIQPMKAWERYRDL